MVLPEPFDPGYGAPCATTASTRHATVTTWRSIHPAPVRACWGISESSRARIALLYHAAPLERCRPIFKCPGSCVLSAPFTPLDGRPSHRPRDWRLSQPKHQHHACDRYQAEHPVSICARHHVGLHACPGRDRSQRRVRDITRLDMQQDHRRMHTLAHCQHGPRHRRAKGAGKRADNVEQRATRRGVGRRDQGCCDEYQRRHDKGECASLHQLARQKVGNVPIARDVRRHVRADREREQSARQ